MPDTAKRTSLRDRWRVGVAAQLRGDTGTVWGLQHAQDLITITVGVILLVMATILILSGIVDFISTAVTGNVKDAAISLLDTTLLVLILVEIVHTVVLSLRAHRLAAQPLLVVGLIAVIRRILFLLSTQGTVSVTELALLIGMVVAFVAGLITVTHFVKQPD